MPLGKSRILITGGTGFLGYELASYLAKKYDIIVTSKRKKKNYIHLDYPKKKIKDKTLKNVETIIHLASLDREEVKKNYKKAKKINFDLTKELIECSIKNRVKNFIYISSISVYGENLSNNTNEKIKPKPKDGYSKLKLLCERLLKQKSDKQKILILRLSNIIGKPQIITKGYRKLFIPNICLSALKKNKIILKTNGDQYRDFLELNLFLKIINSFLIKIDKINNFSIFNISSYNSLKVIDITKKVSFIFKGVFNKKIKIIKGKKISEKKYSINNEKMKAFLNLKIKNNYNKTLLEIINFLKK
jgi:UDP-glucose 4-epimerase